MISSMCIVTQLVTRIPVILGGRRIRIHDPAALRLDQQHDGIMALEHTPEALLALAQGLFGPDTELLLVKGIQGV